MADQLDLLERYPFVAGSKVPAGPSRQAAVRIERSGKAKSLRERVLGVLRLTPMTADEVASRLNASPFSVRPRLTELAEQKLITDAGIRRPSSNGSPATVWRIAT